jgi:Tfp pilus assembly protein PilF
VRGEGYRLIPHVRARQPGIEKPATAALPNGSGQRKALYAVLGLAGMVVAAALLAGLPRLNPGLPAAAAVEPRPLPSTADELVRALAHGGEGHPELAERWRTGQDGVPPSARQAYDLYLEALEWMGRPAAGNYAEASALLERALEAEPDFAHAYVMKAWLLARSQIHTTYQTSGRRQSAAAIEQNVADYAAHALRLDPGLGRAYLPLADLYETAWRWSEADEAYAKALDLSPSDPYVLYRASWFKSFSSRHAEAIALAERAIDVQPEFSQGWLDLGLAQLYAGEPAAAAASLYQAAAIDAGNIDVRTLLGLTEAALGNTIAAEAQLRAVERLLGETRPVAALPKLAIGYSRLDRPADVERIVAEIERNRREYDVGAGILAVACLAAGDREGALHWLEVLADEAARHERGPAYYASMNLKHNVFAHPVLEEAEFAALRARLQGD